MKKHDFTERPWLPFPGSHTNDMHICNLMMTCLLHMTVHHKRLKQKVCPVGSVSLANIHVSCNTMMASLL